MRRRPKQGASKLTREISRDRAVDAIARLDSTMQGLHFGGRITLVPGQGSLVVKIAQLLGQVFHKDSSYRLFGHRPELRGQFTRRPRVGLSLYGKRPVEVSERGVEVA
jgi:hypothetical protein